MRKNRENQLPLTPLWPDHQLSYELQMISRILDDNPEILDLVLQDLSDKTDPQKGSPGLSAEQVLRCAVLKTWQQLSYQKLAFHLGRLDQPSRVLPLALGMDTVQKLSARQHQPDSSFQLGEDQSSSDPLGGG